eukprot:Gregarina_sp_Pseudo_9__2750@NODE_2993_length_791_cov_19_840426_g2733_i0_p2_GENE_NODE_2993_length_791_cov_19_840426_g2733_i0NODE_2993_length_791_cov_19_840426_g2733_i0_p2_ORF_typecomplete_len178_score23_25_NODE_2993_length_791_cov_19_840426_g2733_i0106639
MAGLGAWTCLLLSANGFIILSFWGHLLASRSGAIRLSSTLKEPHAAGACYFAAVLYLCTGVVSAWRVATVKSRLADDPIDGGKGFAKRKRRWNDTPSSRHRKSLAPEIEPLLAIPVKTHSVRIMSPAEFAGVMSHPGPRLHLSQFKSSFSSDFTPPPSPHGNTDYPPPRLSRVNEGM